MKLLLDTHVWLWGFLEPGRISSKVQRELDNPSHQLWLSPISLWEIGLLHSKNKLVLDPNPEDWITKALNDGATQEASLTHEIVLAANRLAMPHRDPADRFLVATANVLGLTLVTADTTLISAKCCPVLANR